MRQKSLFPGAVLTEEELEAIISPLYPKLWVMIRDPIVDVFARRTNDRGFRILDEGQTAQWLRPQIVDRARQLFEGDEEMDIDEKNQQLFLNYKDKIAIIPKKYKLNRRGELTFSSYPTQQNIAIWQQEAVDGFPNLPRIIVGYQFTAEMTAFKIWVAYPYGKWLRDCFLMPDPTGAVVGIFQPTPDVAEEEPEKGYTVKPKRSTRERELDQP